MVQSIANQTFKGVVDRDTLNAFARRLTALATAHDALLHQTIESAQLKLLLDKVLGDAVKYGSLSTTGTVRISWWLDGEGDGAELTVCWTETGAPPAVQPSRKGFGSRLVSMGLVGSGGSTLDYGPEGLKAVFKATIAELRRS